MIQDLDTTSGSAEGVGVGDKKLPSKKSVLDSPSLQDKRSNALQSPLKQGNLSG